MAYQEMQLDQLLLELLRQSQKRDVELDQLLLELTQQSQKRDVETDQFLAEVWWTPVSKNSDVYIDQLVVELWYTPVYGNVYTEHVIFESGTGTFGVEFERGAGIITAGVGMA